MTKKELHALALEFPRQIDPYVWDWSPIYRGWIKTLTREEAIAKLVLYTLTHEQGPLTIYGGGSMPS